MRQGVQTLMQEAGESACYALAIGKIAEDITGEEIDVIGAFYKAFERGYIYYNPKNANDSNNFFVRDPAAFLGMLVDDGRKWTVSKVDANYTAKPGEYIVNYWERQVTGKTIGHFRLADWDSLADSQTVKYGKIVSKRVFRRAG